MSCEGVKSYSTYRLSVSTLQENGSKASHLYGACSAAFYTPNIVCSLCSLLQQEA